MLYSSYRNVHKLCSTFSNTSGPFHFLSLQNGTKSYFVISTGRNSKKPSHATVPSLYQIFFILCSCVSSAQKGAQHIHGSTFMTAHMHGSTCTAAPATLSPSCPPPPLSDYAQRPKSLNEECFYMGK